MSEAARPTATASGFEASSDRHHRKGRDLAIQGQPGPDTARATPGPSRHKQLFAAERPLMSVVSDRTQAEDALDLHALAWVDAFRDHGHTVCFDKVRGQLAQGNDQVMPMFLSHEVLQAIGRALQSYRDRLLKLRYRVEATAGPADME